jgi:hypothetical protein
LLSVTENVRLQSGGSSLLRRTLPQAINVEKGGRAR